jgi:hypothetical protein
MDRQTKRPTPEPGTPGGLSQEPVAGRRGRRPWRHRLLKGAVWVVVLLVCFALGRCAVQLYFASVV